MTDLIEIADKWCAMWNCDVPAEQIVEAAAPIHFGRLPPEPRDNPVIGHAALQKIVDVTAERLNGPLYSVAKCVLGQEPGWLTLLWHVDTVDFGRRTGLDLLRISEGRVAEVWSITGDLPLQA